MTELKKIGIVCPYDMFRGGGVQEVVRAQYTGLTKMGYEVKIITPKPYHYDGEVPKHMILIGASSDFRSPFATTSQLSSGVDNDIIDEILDREQFDLLHFHEPWVPMLSRQLLGRSKARNVATFHAKLPETMMTRTIERVITPYTRSVIKYLHGYTAVSDAAAAYVKTLTTKPITIIPNGINLKKYNVSKPGAKQTKTILYIGRLEKRKGVKYLIKAFEQLADHDRSLRLILAGDGPDREKLEAGISDEHLHRISFKGYVDETEKIKLIKKASLFCSPALFGESFGIVLLEAMASGTVAVAGNNPGYASVLTGTGRISLVNPEDTDEFARRLQLLLEDVKLRDLWQQWAKEEIEQYDYSSVIKSYEAFYRQILAEK